MGAVAVTPRDLQFVNFDEALAEVDRLHRDGYERAGNWGLAQVCDHLTYFIDCSLDGAKFRVPWLLRVLFGRKLLRRILASGRMRAGAFTPQRPLPLPGTNEEAAIARFRAAVQRLLAHPGEMHDSPFFGYLTPEEWRRLHLIHSAHHLGFLKPRN
jgi:hypothetical protein